MVEKTSNCVAYSGYGTVKKDAKMMMMKMLKRKREVFSSVTLSVENSSLPGYNTVSLGELF